MYEYMRKIRCELADCVSLEVFRKAIKSSQNVTNTLASHLVARFGRI